MAEDRLGGGGGWGLGTSSRRAHPCDLLNLDADVLIQTDAAAGGQFAGVRPIIDGALLPEPVFNVFDAGRQSSIPLLVGSAADEGGASLSLANDLKTFRETARAALGSDYARFLDFYPASTDAEARRASQQSNGDRLFSWQAWAWANLHAKSGAPTWYYRFSQAPPVSTTDATQPPGAFHGASLYYGFDRFALKPDWAWTDEDRRFGQAHRRLWVEFARSGDPTQNDFPTWRTFDPTRPSAMILSTDAQILPAPEQDMLRFWDQHYAGSRLIASMGRK